MITYNILNKEYRQIKLRFNAYASNEEYRCPLYYHEWDSPSDDTPLDDSKIDKLKSKLFFYNDRYNFDRKLGYIFENDNEVIDFLLADSANKGKKLKIKGYISGSTYPHEIVIYENVPKVISLYLNHSKKQAKKETPLILYPIKILKEILFTRKKLVEKYKLFLESKDFLSDMDYGRLFVRLFNYYPIYSEERYERKLDFDELYEKVISNFKDKNTKTIKTNFSYDWPPDYDNWGPESNAVSFQVITDISLEENHRYTKKEIDFLLENKKIIILKMLEDHMENDELNMAKKLTKKANIYQSWWAQPIAINYIRNDKNLCNQMFELIDNFMRETSIIKEKIGKNAQKIHKNQQNNYKFDNFEKMRKEEIRHENIKQRIQNKSQLLEKNISEINEFINEK